ncbi:MAG TPA: hypothetical protein VHW65_05470 [Gemmatimonadales bacterium]|nr:hypothetical protein [Gemmatimonadales bacterium]
MRMPVLVATAALIPLLAAAPVTASAQQKSSSSSDMSLSFRFGTQGLGLELAKLVAPHIGLRVGYEFFSDSINQSSSDVSYGVSAKLHSFNGLVDLYPGARGSFHFTAGVVTNPLEAKGSAVPSSSGTITLNGHDYPASSVGTLTADAKFSSLAPYVGIGTGTAANHGGGVFFLFDLGVRIGKPTFSLATDNTGNSTLVGDVNAQQAKTQTDFNKLPVYPVLSFGLGYRF